MATDLSHLHEMLKNLAFAAEAYGDAKALDIPADDYWPKAIATWQELIDSEVQYLLSKVCK